MQKLIDKLQKGISIKCRIGRNDYALEGYKLLQAIDLLGMYGANPKSKEDLDKMFYEQLKEKLEDTGLQGKILANSTDKVIFYYEEIYNKLFAFNLVEFYYNEHDDVNKIKLSQAGLEIYKEWKRNS